jgi:hypothetical protein
VEHARRERGVVPHRLVGEPARVARGARIIRQG